MPTHCTPPRRPLAATERERAGTWRQVGSTDRGAGPRVGWFLSWRKACSFPTCWARGASYWRVSTTTARPPSQKKKKRKNNLVRASETPRGVSRGRSSLVSELRLQRTLNCTAAWSGLWTVAGEMSAKDPPTCVGVRAPWEASGGQLQD